jgi:hypothetical protein
MIVTHAKEIDKYMDLAFVYTASFKEVIRSKLNTQKEPILTLNISTNPKFQKLMLPILMMEMGCWRNDIGTKIQFIL